MMAVCSLRLGCAVRVIIVVVVYCVLIVIGACGCARFCGGTRDGGMLVLGVCLL